MAKFTAYWLTGKAEVLEGCDFTEAFNKNYSAGALRALDFYGEGEPDPKYVWDKKKRTWINTEIT